MWSETRKEDYLFCFWDMIRETLEIWYNTYVRMLKLPTDSRLALELLKVWGWKRGKFNSTKSMGTFVTHLSTSIFLCWWFSPQTRVPWISEHIVWLLKMHLCGEKIRKSFSESTRAQKILILRSFGGNVMCEESSCWFHPQPTVKTIRPTWKNP